MKEKEEKVKKEMEAKEFAKAFEKALNKRMKEMEDRHNETLKTLGTAIVDTIRINTPKKNKEATPLTPEGWDCSLNKSGDV